jgi:hypothetical protein
MAQEFMAKGDKAATVFTRRDMALRLLELYRCWCGFAWGDEASNLLGRCECYIHLQPIFRLYGTHKLAK